MSGVAQISEFGKILIFLITGIVMVCVAFMANSMLAPNHPNALKQSSYECGEEATGSAWLPFNTRFYVIALVFLLFDVEMVFIFPWATVFGSHELNAADPRWGWLSLLEMFGFLGVLILGLVYVWVKGDLEWIKPSLVVPVTDVKIPASFYDRINAEQSRYQVKAFAMEPVSEDSLVNEEPVVAAPVRKPMFKPAFKKPANE